MIRADFDPSWRSPRVWAVPLGALLGCAAIALSGTNVAVFYALNRIGPATNDTLWACLTILGDTLIALTLGLILARRRPELLWAILPVALLATAWVHTIKPLIDLSRPPAVLPREALHIIGPPYLYHSMPSGHTTTAFALAGLCVLGFRMGWSSVLPIGLAVLVGMSRSVVGIHWPLDLLVGAFGGWLAAVLGLKLALRLPFGMRPPLQWLIALAFCGCALWLIVGHQTEYADARFLEIALGVSALVAFALTFVSRPRRASSESPPMG